MWRNPQERVVVYELLNFHNLVTQFQFFVHIEYHCFEKPRLHSGWNSYGHNLSLGILGTKGSCYW